MEPHDGLQDFPELPHLLGTCLFKELFDDNSTCQPDKKETHNNFQRAGNPAPSLNTDANTYPSDRQHVGQPSQMQAHENPQTLKDLSLLQKGLLPGNNFHSLGAMTCPLNTDAYPEPVFNCDCGERFDNIDSMITHRETAPQHKPWHSVWNAPEQGICLCGRFFDSEFALHRHIRLASPSVRRRHWDSSMQRIKDQQSKLPKQPQQPLATKQTFHPGSAGNSQEREETAKLQRHVKDIDKLIVEATMRQLVEEKDEIDKAKGQANKKMSQKQRKKMEKEKAMRLAGQLQNNKLLDGKQ